MKPRCVGARLALGSRLLVRVFEVRLLCTIRNKQLGRLKR